eukprot:TRINITY_DN5178_c0_g1_i3.p1 TRINITY_DN5178_c0_g1~~TRINITY_DN5178_c0_g1_i3.p1  ORF type:complete len:1449 (+),score=423.25 TRINITY_DN5178_c0_g1_i3:68-4348(+)
MAQEPLDLGPSVQNSIETENSSGSTLATENSGTSSSAGASFGPRGKLRRGRPPPPGIAKDQVTDDGPDEGRRPGSGRRVNITGEEPDGESGEFGNFEHMQGANGVPGNSPGQSPRSNVSFRAMGARFSRSFKRAFSRAQSFAEASGDDEDEDGGEAWEIYVNDEAKNAPLNYPPNFLKTSHYTAINFLPLNLFHQFQNIANFYFLIVMLFSIFGESPITPASAIVPLLFVLTTTACKEAWEDWKRHKADKEDNSGLVQVLRGKQWVDTPSMNIRVGDIIKIERNEAVKADVVILASDDDDGVVYIETSQLDGETSVKPRKAKHETVYLNEPNAIHDATLAASTVSPRTHATNESECYPGLQLSVDHPNPKIYSWQGVLTTGGSEKVALSTKNVIWRGSSVRKCAWAICVVIYTGHCTKQGKNLKKAKRKLSFFMKKVNAIVLSIFILKHFLLIPLSCLTIWWRDAHDDHWYVSETGRGESDVEAFFMNYMTYFVLLSFLIPISLFVTLELCKVQQFMSMKWDQDMMHFMQGLGWVTCRPKTSDLNDQLAVVRYVFTDKTGTLTENIMRYMEGAVLCTGQGRWVEHNECTEPGSLGRNPDTQALLNSEYDSLLATGGAAADLVRYISCMCACHTVVPFVDEHNPEVVNYEGTSPDEVALVKAAADNGFALLKRTSKIMDLMIGGQKVSFEIICELEFTPTRKMMSIVLKDEAGKMIILTKGADSSVMANLAPSFAAEHPTLMKQGQEIVGKYASKQYRTLCFAYRHVEQEEYDAWQQRYNAIQTQLGKTDEMVDEVCIQLESKLHLVGVAAYEDKLQDGVPDTIRFLVDAGVTVWMLTGDKIETGIEIGKTCGLAEDAEVIPCYLPRDIDAEMASVPPTPVGSGELSQAGTDADQDLSPQDYMQLRKERLMAQKIASALERAEAIVASAAKPDHMGPRKVTIAVDGPTIDVLQGQKDGTLAKNFMELSKFIHSAICCRLTPSQKGYIVTLFQRETGETALAIGDGANDATMISAATVGIGIIGLEGSQAELASDYAIPRFRFLKRLLAVHGRYAIYRNARCVCFSFYKNIVLSLCMVFYAFYSAFSGMSVFDSWLLAIKNTLFDFLPPFLMGCYGKDISEEVLMDAKVGPQLYRQVREQGLYFNNLNVLVWLLSSILHGFLIFWSAFPLLEQDDADPIDGRTGGVIHTGTVMMSMVVFTCITKAAIHIHQVTSIQAGGIVFSYIFYVLFLVAYAAVKSVFGDTAFHGTRDMLFNDPKHIFYILFAVFGVVVLCDFTVVYIQRQTMPSLRDIWSQFYPYKNPPWAHSRPLFGLALCGSGPRAAEAAQEDAATPRVPQPRSPGSRARPSKLQGPLRPRVRPLHEAAREPFCPWAERRRNISPARTARVLPLPLSEARAAPSYNASPVAHAPRRPVLTSQELAQLPFTAG